MNTSLSSLLFLGFVVLHANHPTVLAQSGPATTPPAASTARNPSSDREKVQVEVDARYAAAHPEIQEYVLWTASTFGRSGLWKPEDAYAELPRNQREKRITHLARLLNESEYGRHLCAGLAEASALKDPRLVPGLMKVAGYHLENKDYDCRAKWMAVAALARQEADESVALLIGLVDHGNQNTRNWSRAALARKTGKDFKQDKQAWATWWTQQGHPAIDAKYLKPWTAPVPEQK